MYKTRLQELCQKNCWELPVYTSGKSGPCHVPRFTATVTVKGQVFETPEEFRSVKEAQNTAARIAFEHINAAAAANGSAPPAVNSQTAALLAGATPIVPPPKILLPLSPLAEIPLSPNPTSVPNPTPGFLQKKIDAKTKPTNGEVMRGKCADTKTPVVSMIAIDKGYEAGLSMYKNQLQQYAQKEDLGFPVYTTEAQGPPHDRRFKSKVCVDGKLYETPDFLPTLKEAEQAAAKVACQALSVDIIQEDGVLYKNLLQEFAQKKGLPRPSYETVSSGMSHRPTFVSVVAIGTDTFRGAEAKTKKQAEMNAAKVAYFDLTKGFAITNSTMASAITECPIADDLSQNILPTSPSKTNYGTSNEGFEDTNSTMASTITQPPIAGDHSQNILPTSPIKTNNGDPANEEHALNADRANATPGNMNVVPPPFDQIPKDQPLLKWKTVVFPRELNWPIPENATVLPFSDEQWVAFRIRLDKEATA